MNSIEGTDAIRYAVTISELEFPVTDIKEFSQLLLSAIARIMEISQGAFFLSDGKKKIVNTVKPLVSV